MEPVSMLPAAPTATRTKSRSGRLPRLLAASLALFLAGCDGDLRWTLVLSMEGPNPSVPASFRSCGDGNGFVVGGSVVLRRDLFGGYTKVDVCGAHATRADGQPRLIDLHCHRDGSLAVLCGTDAAQGQVLVSFDAQKNGTTVPLPLEGRAVLVPSPDATLVATEAGLHVLEGTTLRPVREHTLGEVREGAATGPDDAFLGLADGTTHRLTPSGATRIEGGNSEYLRPVLRDRRVYVQTTFQNGEGTILRFEPGAAEPVDLRAQHPQVTRPAAPVDVLADDTIVYVAFFRSGFEFENPGAHLWTSRPGAGDYDYRGSAPMVTGGGLYVAGSGGFGSAIDANTFLTVNNGKLFEGHR